MVLVDHFYQAFRERLGAIRKAKNRILLEPHHLNPDRLGQWLLHEIIQAKKSRPQLRVQILLDYWGASHFTPELALLLIQSGIEIKYFNYPAIYQFWQLNFRTHRKILVIDDQVFIGGFNHSEDFFGLHAEVNMLDREVLLSGLFADQAEEAIQKLWNSAWSCHPEQVLNWNVSWMPWSWKLPDSSSLRKKEAEKIFQQILDLRSNRFRTGLRSSPPFRFQVEENKIELIFDHMSDPGLLLNHSKADRCAGVFYELLENAKDKIDLESLYFLPTPRLYELLHQKLSEKVKINILTNGVDSMDKQSGEILSLSLKYFDLLLKENLKLWGIKGRSWPNKNSSRARRDSFFATHAKSYVFDNNTYLGSLNMDPRSFETNLESAVLIRNDKKFAAAVRRSIRYRTRQQALPMNSWAQLIQPGALVGQWTSLKTMKYLALAGLRRIVEPYY